MNVFRKRRVPSFTAIYRLGASSLLIGVFCLVSLLLNVQGVQAASVTQHCQNGKQTCHKQKNQNNQQQNNQQQQNVAMNCTIIVPPDPLSAQGLATPYLLAGVGEATQGTNACHEANAMQTAFVQATIFDPQTNSFSVYIPLVIDKDTQPAIPPTVPTLPANAVVAIAFGFNGTDLTLVDNQGSLKQGNCINGLPDSDFGQVAFCNDVPFFNTVNTVVQAGHLVVPPLGMAKDGQMCPSTRDFSVVDMDQSDNVTAQYLSINGQLAQNTPTNLQTAKTMLDGQGPQVLSNASDNRLLTAFIDPALGCSPWQVPNVTDPNSNNDGAMSTSLHLDELQAALTQAPPIALVPDQDEMTLVNNKPSLDKINLYRVNVDQMPGQSFNDTSTKVYCQNLLQTGLPRIAKDKQLTMNFTSPDAGMANNLFTFLAMRFNQTFGAQGLGCMQLLQVQNPVTLTTQNNVVTDASINLNPAPLNGGTAGQQGGGDNQSTSVLICRVNQNTTVAMHIICTAYLISIRNGGNTITFTPQQ